MTVYKPIPEDRYRRSIETPSWRTDPETGAWPVPKEGDVPSPFQCDECRYEHNMHWGDDGILRCYRCTHWIIPPPSEGKGYDPDRDFPRPPPVVKEPKRD